MTLPAFRSAGALAHDIVGVTPGAPAGLTAGDVELLVCESQDQAISLTTANGFAEVPGSPISVPSGTATVATRGALFWRRWNGTDGDPTTNDPGNHILAQRFAFSGCIGSGNPWDVLKTSSEAVEDTSGSADGDTTTVADCLIAIVVGAAKPDTVSTAELSGFTNADLTSLTERADNAGNSGNGGHIGLATGGKASAGTFGATTYTKATAAYKWHFVVALKPEPAAGDAVLLPALGTADEENYPDQDWTFWLPPGDVVAPEDFQPAGEFGTADEENAADEEGWLRAASADLVEGFQPAPVLVESAAIFDDTLYQWVASPLSADVAVEALQPVGELHDTDFVTDDTDQGWTAGPNSLAGLPGFTIGRVRVTSAAGSVVVTLTVKGVKREA